MSELFLLPVHSTVSLITNSSSTLFILGTERSVDTTKTLLTEIGRVWGGENYDIYSSALGDAFFSVNGDWDPPSEVLDMLHQPRWERDREFDPDHTVAELHSRMGRLASLLLRDSDEDLPRRALCKEDHEILAKYYDAEAANIRLDVIEAEFAAVADQLAQKSAALREYLTSWLGAPPPPLLVTFFYEASSYLDEEECVDFWRRVHAHVLSGGVLSFNLRYDISYALSSEAQAPLIAKLNSWGSSFGDDYASTFFHACLRPMVGEYVLFTSKSDNSVPETLHQTLCNLLPALKSWSLG